MLLSRLLARAILELATAKWQNRRHPLVDVEVVANLPAMRRPVHGAQQRTTPGASLGCLHELNCHAPLLRGGDLAILQWADR
jgi:hypothetical protein